LSREGAGRPSSDQSRVAFVEPCNYGDSLTMGARRQVRATTNPIVAPPIA
jgi:hypothetical protein